MTFRSQRIRTYLLAKDHNRPHLMTSAFADAARLNVDSRSEAMSFQPVTHGLDAITKALVRDFGRAFENVYTFCLCDEPKSEANGFKCSWLVGMSEKATGAVRVGCGDYDWSFGGEQRLVDRLSIVIRTMKVLHGDQLRPVMTWLSALPYPWCPPSAALKEMPHLAELAEIRQFLGAT
jgi:hypothetical protein